MKQTIKYVTIGLLWNALMSILTIGSIALGIKNLIFDVPNLNGFLALVLGMVDIGLIISGLFVCGMTGYFIYETQKEEKK